MIQMETRKQLNELFFGTNGTGKTTNMLDLACKYAESNPKKNVLFLMPDDSETKYDDIPLITKNELLDNFGIAKILVDIENNKKESIYETIYKVHQKHNVKFNGLIVNDDMGVTMSRRPQPIITLLSRRRQLNLDLFWNFHGFTTDAPKSFFRFITGITLHKTTDDYRDTFDKLNTSSQEAFLAAYKRVQDITRGVKSENNPEGLMNPYYNERVKIV